jgi:signal transduction histidine kinase
MDEAQATDPRIEQESVNHLTSVATQMETTPFQNEPISLVDQSFDIYQKEYSEFIDLASHELDAPLRKISLLTSRLTEKFGSVSENKEVHNYLARLNRCVQDMQSVVESMAALSKIAAARLRLSVCKLEEIIGNVISDLAVPITNAGATFDQGELPAIKADAGQLSQLFENLIDNAIKFRKENIAPEIKIRSSLLADEEQELLKLQGKKQYLKIEITDNGIGFKNENAEKIFRPFVRLNGKSRFAGDGLGLAICRKIAENHQGLIFATGVENEGSRFILLLPQIL